MKIENIIIGAGPAGLAVAGRMTRAKIPYILLEKSKHPGNAWRNHYDRLHLHTIKAFSHLPHLPFPKHYPTYVPRLQLIDYFESYVKHFNIQPQYESSVKSIQKKEDKDWEVICENGQHYSAKNVVIATGVNRIPNIPTWPEQDTFKGNIIHSARYKNPKPYSAKKVCVIGMGNTGAEIAYDLSEHEVETYISVRGTVNIVPRDLNGRPVQTTSKQLEKLPFGLGNWIGGQVRKFYFGDLSKYGIKTSKEYPAVQLKKTGKTPVIDIGTVEAIKQGKITVKGEIEKFTPEGIQFKSGETVQIDEIILATGYKASLGEFLIGIEKNLDKYGCPKSPLGQGNWKGIYFIGFDNYKLGGILGTIGDESERIVNSIQTEKTVA